MAEKGASMNWGKASGASSSQVSGLSAMLISRQDAVHGHFSLAEHLLDMELQEEADLLQRGCLARVVQSHLFEFLSLLVILSNTFFACYTTNYYATEVTYDQLPWMTFCERMFLGYYTLELLLKIAFFRCDFLCSAEKYWNLFDLTIVLLSVFELVTIVVLDTGNKKEFNFTFIRAVRVFKVLRVLRIFRALRFLRELRMMMTCVVSSMAALVWSGVFLFFILMVAALIFVQILTGFRIENPKHDGEDGIEKWFSSIQQAMVVLFGACTGGVDWGDLYEVVSLSGWLSSLLFILYIVVVQFSFFNLVTSMFVEKAMKQAEPDMQDLIAERNRELEQTERRLRRVITLMDKDGDGYISLAEMDFMLANPDVKTYFEMNGLNIMEVEGFFRTLLILQDATQLKVEEFIAGCMKAKGMANSLDMLAVKFQMGSIATDVSTMLNYLGISRMPSKRSGLVRTSTRVTSD